MYNARIDTDDKKSFAFSYDNGVIFDITPLSGVSVALGLSQGFQQIGQSVEAQSVSGITRTIKGVILNQTTAQQMLAIITPFATGKLYFNDTYFCDIYIKHSPIVTNKKGKILFSLEVFSPHPYWQQKDEAYYSVSAFVPMFSFPVNYNSHTFGYRDQSSAINAKNAGVVPVPGKFEFTCTSDVQNYGMINIATMEKLQFIDTLLPDEKVVLEQEKGRIIATKYKGEQMLNHMPYLSDDSTLFNLNVGTNPLKLIADGGEDNLSASVSLRPAYMGVFG